MSKLDVLTACVSKNCTKFIVVQEENVLCVNHSKTSQAKTVGCWPATGALLDVLKRQLNFYLVNLPAVMEEIASVEINYNKKQCKTSYWDFFMA